MYDRLLDYLDSGGSLLYLGGNGIFENGEYTDEQTQMVFWAGDRPPGRGPRMFRRLTLPRPERTLLGVTTERCGANGSPYEVVEPEHSIFRWTGLRHGELFGDTGLNTGSATARPRGGRSTPSTGPARRTCPWTASIEPGHVTRLTIARWVEVIARAMPEEPAGRGARCLLPTYRRRDRAVGRITHVRRQPPVDPAIQQILRNALTEAGVV